MALATAVWSKSVPLHSPHLVLHTDAGTVSQSKVMQRYQ